MTDENQQDVEKQKAAALFSMGENYSRTLSIPAIKGMLRILKEMTLEELEASIDRLAKKKPYDRMPTAGMIWDDYTDHRKVKINVREVWSQERAQEFLKDK